MFNMIRTNLALADAKSRRIKANIHQPEGYVFKRLVKRQLK